VPPPDAEFLLYVVLPKDHESLIGDIEEQYRSAVVPRLGPSAARRWFWWQVLHSVPIVLSWRIRRLFDPDLETDSLRSRLLESPSRNVGA
jgi:hypothetical protein